MWWFRGLHANLIAAWKEAAPEARILDAGCGTGGLLARLAARLPGAALIGLDRDAAALSITRAKSGRRVILGTVDTLPFDEASFDAIFSADVLCHRGVDAARALAEFCRCLRPGGVVILNLPAYRWLYSAHDIAVDNARRFGRQELAALLVGAGFVRLRIRYWNGLLFPFMLVRRLLMRGGGSDVTTPAPLLNRSLWLMMRAEAILLRAGWGLPFGGSLLARAMKP